VENNFSNIKFMRETFNNKEPNKRVENTESLKLNPEILETVMSKVQDINRNGIAFHTTSRYNPEHLLDNIKSLLKDGLLGRGSSNSTNPSAWAKGVRKNKIAEIYFNITGRFRSVIYEDDGKGGEFEKVLPSTIRNNVWGSKQGVTILFDVKTFKEVKPPEGNEA
jgi:hypothetical protein